MEELLDGMFGLLLFWSPVVTPFVLVTFTPVKRLHQPIKFFVVGIVSGIVAAFLSVLESRGTIRGRGVFLIVGLWTLGGAIISLLFSSGAITEKNRDELVRKSDDQSWRL